MTDYVKLRAQLEQAERELNLAGGRVYQSASGVEPFRLSKFLNILGKQISQMKIELAICLGNYNTNIEEMEKVSFSFPSTKLLKIMKDKKQLIPKEEESK